MKIVIDTSTITDANAFGELLRAQFFVQNGEYGGYNNFDLTDSFSLVKRPNAWIEKAEDGDIYYTTHCHNDDSKIFVAWHWDGDGTLVISDGERIAINTDCKKSHGWQWAEMP